MNYSKIYGCLVEKARSEIRTRVSYKDSNYVYYENHHIIPRCLGGSDEDFNRVLLTAREHFVAHWLLTKIYPDSMKLLLAFSRCRSSSSKHKANNSKSYKYAKEALARANSLREWTEASKEGIRYSNSHRVCTERTKMLRSQNLRGNTHTLGHKLTQEHKNKISEWSRNMPLEARKKQIASYQRRKSEKKICEYCGTEVSIASYDKAHGDRCKFNPNCIRKKHRLVCLNCGLEFESFHSLTKYCSDKCKRNYYGRK